MHIDKYCITLKAEELPIGNHDPSKKYIRKQSRRLYMMAALILMLNGGLLVLFGYLGKIQGVTTGEAFAISIMAVIVGIVIVIVMTSWEYKNTVVSICDRAMLVHTLGQVNVLEYYPEQELKIDRDAKNKYIMFINEYTGEKIRVPSGMFPSIDDWYMRMEAGSPDGLFSGESKSVGNGD